MNDKYVAYIGTYTHGSSIGIHICDVNVEEGTLTEPGHASQQPYVSPGE